MMDFWASLKKPFFVLAPMADVTDAAFRVLIASIKTPDVTWTEFVSADGLYHTREMKKIPDDENPLMRDLQYSEAERPIVAQLFSSKPEMMEYAAELVAKLGFDGVDINMGCPDKSIERQGCGAAMIKTPDKAVEVIEAARRGVAKHAAATGTVPIPISVKTRIGYNKESIDEWIPVLLRTNLPALTVHLRTRKEMSKVVAHWELMPRIVALRDEIAPNTKIIGNGDATDLADAQKKIDESGCDGVMLGRGIFGNPWLFTGRTNADVPIEEKLEALATLAHSFQALRPAKSFHIFKKHIKAFVSNFDGAADLRAILMECEDAGQIEETIANYRALPRA